MRMTQHEQQQQQNSLGMIVGKRMDQPRQVIQIGNSSNTPQMGTASEQY